NRREARAMLGLPHNRRIVLFGAWAGDRRKGLHLLQEALQKLSRAGWGSRMALAVFGPPAANTPDSSDFQTFNLGRFHDALSLSVVYSAADVMVAPSIQEGFGQTASESLACGTPAVVFGGTGLSDIVDHRQNGYVARPFEVDDLAQGIAWVLQDDERRGQLSRAARQKVEREYSLAVQARRYAALFDEVIANHRRAVSQKERL
ncbi:MAG: glycosyltransferase, partial [Anaerolineae bacterium]